LLRTPTPALALPLPNLYLAPRSLDTRQQIVGRPNRLHSRSTRF
jgi:hypothetical protein